MSQTARNPDPPPQLCANGGSSAQHADYAPEDRRDSVVPSLAQRLGARLGPTSTFATTEHFNLQTARSITVSEANGRASIFLAALSNNLIALAFIGQMSRLGAAFYAFALILLPVLVFVGVVTFLRVVNSVVVAAVAGVALAAAGVHSLSLPLGVGALVGAGALTLQHRHHRRARDAYAPDAVDRAAIFIPPPPQPDTA